MKKRPNPKRKQAFEMKKKGITYKEISKLLQISHATLCRWFCKMSQEQKNKCDVCGIIIVGNYEKFRNKKCICRDCFMNTDSSKCEGLDLPKNDPFYHRVESVFMIDCGTHRRA